MKKTKILMPLMTLTALSGVAAPIATLASCAKKQDPVVKYTVTFDYRDLITETKTVEVNSGSKVEKPADPTLQGYAFKGWFTDVDCTTPFNFDTTITKNIILYAGWELTLDVDSVILESKPSKLSYKQGQALDLAGLKVAAKLNDGRQIELAQGFYETDPAAGTILNELGTKTITVKVGDKTATFDVNVELGVTGITVHTSYDFDNICVGDKIYKSDFEVAASFTDHTYKVVTDWKSNLFDEGSNEYTFSAKGEQLVRIEYEGHQWSTVATVNYTGEYSFTMPTEITLPRSQDATKGFESQKRITVLDNGQPISLDDYTFELAKGSEKFLSIEDNVITTIKATESGKPAEVIVKDSKGIEIADHIKVNVKDVADPAITFPTSLGSIADYKVFESDRNGNCIIPDAIIHNDYSYLLRLSGNEQLNSVKNLYLSNGLYSIWNSKTSFGAKIQNIYFDGTITEWNKRSEFIYTEWMNEFITGVTCNDGFVAKDSASAKATVTWLPSGNIGFATPKFTQTQTGAKFQFDFSNWGDSSEITTNSIKFENINPSAKTNDFVIYADGELLTETTNYKYDFETKTITFIDDSQGVSPIKNKNVVIKSTAIFYPGSYAYTEVNSGEFAINPARTNYNVGDVFNYTAIRATIVFADRTVLDVPGEYLTVKLNGSNIADKHVFTEEDKGENKKITVSLTNFSYSEKEYEITIK